MKMKREMFYSELKRRGLRNSMPNNKDIWVRKKNGYQEFLFLFGPFLVVCVIQYVAHLALKFKIYH